MQLRTATLAMTILATSLIAGNCGPPPEQMFLESTAVPIGGSANMPVEFRQTAASSLGGPFCRATASFQLNDPDGHFSIDPGQTTFPNLPDSCIPGAGGPGEDNIFSFDVLCFGGGIPANQTFVRFKVDGGEGPSGALAQITGLTATIEPCGAGPTSIPINNPLLQLQ